MRRQVSRLWLALVGVAIVSGAALAAALYLLAPNESPGRALAVVAWELRYRAFPAEDASGLAALHAAGPDAPRERCVACHGDKRDSMLLVHRIHLQSDLLTRLGCPECHPKVDLTPRSADAAATWVDVDVCRRCHSPLAPHEPADSGEPVTVRSPCVPCHTGAEEPEHALPYLPASVPETECAGCHGGRVLSWTPLHARPDWLAQHGREALRTGTPGCFDCHDFGLKFCDECHRIKPASHAPADRWRVIHPEEAKRDTRVCYTCHRTSFCKKCHVDHEAGWMQTHPAYVREKGDGSCEECHSPSACQFCHAGQQPGSTSASASAVPSGTLTKP